jgi:hypothetical protein
MRTHNEAIKALRREALRYEKLAQDLGMQPEARSWWRMRAAAYHTSAEYLVSIVGASERKRLPKPVRVEHGRIVRK